MIKFDEMLELEEKMNNAAIDCSVRIRNKYNDPYPDVRVGGYVEGFFFGRYQVVGKGIKEGTSRK